MKTKLTDRNDHNDGRSQYQVGHAQVPLARRSARRIEAPDRLPGQREGGGLVAEQADGEAVERLADRQLR